LIAAFDAIVTGNGYTRDESAVVCRGAALVERIANGAEKTGVGATDRFAQAAIYRDREGDIAKAFELTIHGILKLLKRPPIGFRADTLRNSSEPTSKAVRRVVWHFIKDRDHGLPSSSLLAKDQWHPLLKQRVPALLQRLEAVAQVTHSETWTRNLTVKDLPVGALWKRDLLTTDAASIRVQTVHKVKGEGIGAVLYVAKTADLKSLVAETNSEDRRIGYVAVTRARDLLVVGVPSKAPSHLVKALEDRGLVPWSATIAVAQEEKHHAKTV
jgi:hypothetical protein